MDNEERRMQQVIIENSDHWRLVCTVPLSPEQQKLVDDWLAECKKIILNDLKQQLKGTQQ